MATQLERRARYAPAAGGAASLPVMPRAQAAEEIELPVAVDEPSGSVVDLLTPGQARPLTELDISEAAASIHCDVAALKAVMEVEASGSPFMRDGFPKIRPELHKFHKYTDGWFALQRFVPVSNPRGLLRQMAENDLQAAMRATSWGLGQVMGFNFRLAGCESVEQLVVEAKASAGAQLRHMVNYIRHAGLDGHLRAQDWERFAAGYNGPQWRRNDYAGKLARAYQRISGAASWIVLRLGARGPAVERLQRGLTAAGYLTTDDGHFSTETEASLRAFQAERGLEVDGVAGAKTWAALALVEAAERDRVTAPAAPAAPDTTLDELTKVGGAVSTVGAATSGGGWLAIVFGGVVVLLVGFFIYRKFRK